MGDDHRLISYVRRRGVILAVISSSANLSSARVYETKRDRPNLRLQILPPPLPRFIVRQPSSVILRPSDTLSARQRTSNEISRRASLRVKGKRGETYVSRREEFHCEKGKESSRCDSSIAWIIETKREDVVVVSRDVNSSPLSALWCVRTRRDQGECDPVYWEEGIYALCIRGA